MHVHPSIRSAKVSWLQDTENMGRVTAYLVKFKVTGNIRPVLFHNNGCYDVGPVVGKVRNGKGK